jgi:sodium transport system permease protein
MGPLKAVVNKELLDNLRDRRSTVSVLLFPLAGPLMLMLIAQVVADKQTLPENVKMPSLGAARAPHLVDFLERNGVELIEAPDDFEAAIKRGDIDAVVEVTEEFAKDLQSGRTARVLVWRDRSSHEGVAEIARVQQLLAAYGARLGALRLIARGVVPEVASPIAIEEVDLSTPERLAARLLEMIPLFLIIAALIGGMNVATDATAGERERGSLEPLLLNPVPRSTLVLGKWIATTAFSVTVVSITAVAFSIAVRYVRLEEVGLQVHLGPGRLLVMAAALLPLCAFASSLLLLVATFARSYKEAQLYLSALLMAPAASSVLLLLIPVRPGPLLMLVPALGQQLLVSDLLRGEPASFELYCLAAIWAMVLTAVAIAATAALFRRERIIFGR